MKVLLASQILAAYPLYQVYKVNSGNNKNNFENMNYKLTINHTCNKMK
jgi:hypothetical protein